MEFERGKESGKMVVQPTALLVPTRLVEWDGVEDYFQGLEEVPSCALAGKAFLLFLGRGKDDRVDQQRLERRTKLQEGREPEACRLGLGTWD